MLKNMFYHKKNILIGILVLGVAGYLNVFQKETQAQETLITPDVSVVAENDQQGQEILSLLADLKRIRLDGSIFSDPLFQSLQDFSVELNPEPKGRQNPFAPLGRDFIFSDDVGNFSTNTPRNIPFSSSLDEKNRVGKNTKNSSTMVNISVGI